MTLWKYILRTRKVWLLGLLMLVGLLGAIGAEQGLAGQEFEWPLALWPLGFTLIPAVTIVLALLQGLGWLPDGMLGWVAPLGMVYGLVGVGLLGWLGYRRWRRL
ncbi:MAG: hypothetical protein RMI89_10675 [Gloeomargarita sp. SKYBB_i_bin120]|nr:hypothetical protein [Gloeomargarita sp. SKYG98]MCS7293413.1 hypothetical protein [Gloeomargarita sp. SKYB120]MDW8178979.1 hypothetical protein [Gloeomargarita sp. SKYBB_i_bin120]